MAPIVPHLAEEINQTRFPEGEQVDSIFCKPWIPLVRITDLISHTRLINSKSTEWNDSQLDADMTELLRLRDVVLGLLEKPRQNKCVPVIGACSLDVDLVL